MTDARTTDLRFGWWRVGSRYGYGSASEAYTWRESREREWDIAYPDPEYIGESSEVVDLPDFRGVDIADELNR